MFDNQSECLKDAQKVIRWHIVEVTRPFHQAVALNIVVDDLKINGSLCIDVNIVATINQAGNLVQDERFRHERKGMYKKGDFHKGLYLVMKPEDGRIFALPVLVASSL